MKKLWMVLGTLGLIGGFTVLAVPASGGDVGSYTVELDGASEVPGPGDPDGSGTVTLQLGTVSNEVCVDELSVSNIATPTLFHIHQAPVGVAGPIVVDLVPALTTVPFCTVVDASLMQQLITAPEGFYLNIHNQDFPAGAIRGQLPGQVPPPPTSETTASTSTTQSTAAAQAGRATQPSFTG
jgi:hypothetical protein